MKLERTQTEQHDIVISHFRDRATRYDRSSHWCTDQRMASFVLDHLAPRASDRLLDVACGTGLVAEWFRGKVSETIGVDLTPDMYEQASPHIDRFVECSAEEMPFDDDSFDMVITRQGIQFMDDAAAVNEMTRVCKPGRKVCLIQLCAYGDGDEHEFFEILRLRNPARRNFYLRQNLEELLRQSGCSQVTLFDYVSREAVQRWADNGAIDETAQRKINALYTQPSSSFQKSHCVESSDDEFYDHMLFAVAIGQKDSR